MTRQFLAWWNGPRSDPADVPRPLADAATAFGCTRRCSSDGLSLWLGPDVPVRNLANRAGWIIGDLFDRSGAPAPRTLDVGIARLTRDFWGSYVLLERAGEDYRVTRDPSGGLACYRCTSGGAHVLTSMPHVPVDCGLCPAELDWAAIGRSIVEHEMRGSSTALRAITEILPGTTSLIGANVEEPEKAWDPWAFAAAMPPTDAAEALRSTLGSTLGAWGSSVRRPLVEVSGGLDSAIVAAGIAASAPAASLITFAPSPGDPDERPYAQAIADHLGLYLHIAVPRLGDVDLMRSLSADLPRPNARAFTQAADAQSLDHARRIGADAFFSGGGGDDIFGYVRTVLPAIDRFRADGLRGMLSSALDIADMNHATLWDAIARIARRAVRGRPPPRYDLRFIAADAMSRIGPAEKPCVPPGIPPGKAEHVRAVTTIHNYLEGHARAGFAPILSPLLSQPIVECCLSIESWLWCEGGRNRATARRALREALPQVVLDRRSKGRFDGFCAALLDSNRELVTAMLMEGALAAQGLLDRPATQAALEVEFPSAETISRLLTLVDVEAWAQSWIGRGNQRR